MRLGKLPTNTMKIEFHEFNASHYEAIKKSLNLHDSGNKMAHYKRILKNNIL